MKNRRYLLTMLSVFLILLVAGCGGGDTATSGTISGTESTTAQEETTGTVTELAAGSGESISGEHRYVIVPDESTASYIVHEEFFSGALEKLGIEVGKQDIVGSTNDIEGQLTLNFDDLSAALGENRIAVNLPTLATEESDRDEWLRKNGLESLKFPTAEFVGTDIDGAPANYADGDEINFKLNGTLTVRDIDQPTTFDVTARLVGNTIQGVATTDLLMSSFGIDPPNFANTLTVQDDFTVRVEFVAREE